MSSLGTDVSGFGEGPGLSNFARYESMSCKFLTTIWVISFELWPALYFFVSTPGA